MIHWWQEKTLTPIDMQTRIVNQWTEGNEFFLLGIMFHSCDLCSGFEFFFFGIGFGFRVGL